MSDKYIKEITQNIPNNELNAAYDALMNSSLNETSNYEEVSMEELNEYIEGLECQAEDLRKQLAKANERARELERDSVSDKVSAIKDAFKYAEIKSKNWFKKQFDTMPIEYRDGIDCMVAFLDEYAEQLRKEQE